MLSVTHHILISLAFLDMGFESKLVVEALKQANNDEVTTLQILTDNPGMLMNKNMEYNFVPDRDTLEILMLMGFEEEACIRALQISYGDPNAAVDLLMSGCHEEPENISGVIDEEIAEETSESQMTPEQLEELERQEQLEKEAENELLEDILVKDDLDRFDIDLSEETQLLATYLNLLETQ
eukprot:TRINITY_DN5564_c0_g1_i1.p1 TRINITY_DN5564_c0_g1~~TRINITY_DN5564_c0_g1_i1.p1  ORF type:complete len:181 (+),score=49.78 TRINITY_DN5564_c0_g1_i1:22-564(+)